MLILIVAAPTADVLNHKVVLKTDHSEDLIPQVKDNDVPAGYGVEREIYDTQPIIRYELEDIIGYANQSCECGIQLPSLLPVQGRSSDFIYFRNSQGGYEKFHPYYILVSLFYSNDMRQSQLVQTERNELTFYYVMQKNAAAVEQQVTRILKEALARADLERHVELKFMLINLLAGERNLYVWCGKGIEFSGGLPSDFKT